MIAIKEKPLTALQAAFVQYYADPGSETYNNATQSALKAGYAYNTANNADSNILGKHGIDEALAKYKADISEELAWNSKTNLIEQYEQMDRYKAILAKHPDNLQALQGLNVVYRELNASNGQHSQTINTNEGLVINIGSQRRAVASKEIEE